MPAVEPALAFLLSAQNPDGGWGYAPAQASATEPTAAALLAIEDEPAAADARQQAADWLRQGQHHDGGWGLSHADQESAWQTAWAALALARAGVVGVAFDRGIEWLLSVPMIHFAEDEMQNDIRETLVIDPSLRGWPWLPGEASWIEPTALAMLALQSAPSTPAISTRLDEGVRYIRDRRCKAGGWNVGNPFMFGTALPSRAHQTAWVLLALMHVAPEVIQLEDEEALRSEMLRDGGVAALAWGLLTLRALGKDDVEAQSQLAALQGSNGGWNHNPYCTAVAMMAARGRL
jgi:hypothetical protein